MNLGKRTEQPVKINGTTYDSCNDAARKLGVGRESIRKNHSDLMKSKLSELSTVISVKTSFVFEKVK